MALNEWCLTLRFCTRLVIAVCCVVRREGASSRRARGDGTRAAPLRHDRSKLHAPQGQSVVRSLVGLLAAKIEMSDKLSEVVTVIRRLARNSNLKQICCGNISTKLFERHDLASSALIVCACALFVSLSCLRWLEDTLQSRHQIFLTTASFDHSLSCLIEKYSLVFQSPFCSGVICTLLQATLKSQIRTHVKVASANIGNITYFF